MTRMPVANRPPASTRLRTLGLFLERDHFADELWNQCDGPMGRDGDLQIRFSDPHADHVLVMTGPVLPNGGSRLSRWRKRLARLRGASVAAAKAQHAWKRLGLPRDKVTVMFYEPPGIISDEVFEVARRHASRVFAPDPRATHPIVLPATWWIHEPLASLRELEAPTLESKPIPLAAVSSGKALIPGHAERTRFFGLLREAGIPLELFGKGLPAGLSPRGPVHAKSMCFRPAQFALAIENYAQGDLYVSEKLWDPLLCWTVPLYYGSRAADSIIPPESFIRLPDLGVRGVETVRQVLSTPGLWEARLPALAEARWRALTDLRLVVWARRTLF
ncbi:MAG: hypothetical protein KF745_02110 [Phycisphaeraceae bacterium]|nr:hypothetical protein [Phycisphaeraceae bacterium]